MHHKKSGNLNIEQVGSHEERHEDRKSTEENKTPNSAPAVADGVYPHENEGIFPIELNYSDGSHHSSESDSDEVLIRRDTTPDIKSSTSVLTTPITKMRTSSSDGQGATLLLKKNRDEYSEKNVRSEDDQEHSRHTKLFEYPQSEVVELNALQSLLVEHGINLTAEEMETLENLQPQNLTAQGASANNASSSQWFIKSAETGAVYLMGAIGVGAATQYFYLSFQNSMDIMHFTDWTTMKWPELGAAGINGLLSFAVNAVVNPYYNVQATRGAISFLRTASSQSPLSTLKDLSFALLATGACIPTLVQQYYAASVAFGKLPAPIFIPFTTCVVLSALTTRLVPTLRVGPTLLNQFGVGFTNKSFAELGLLITQEGYLVNRFFNEMKKNVEDLPDEIATFLSDAYLSETFITQLKELKQQESAENSNQKDALINQRLSKAWRNYLASNPTQANKQKYAKFFTELYQNKALWHDTVLNFIESDVLSASDSHQEAKRLKVKSAMKARAGTLYEMMQIKQKAAQTLGLKTTDEKTQFANNFYRCGKDPKATYEIFLQVLKHKKQEQELTPPSTLALTSKRIALLLLFFGPIVADYIFYLSDKEEFDQLLNVAPGEESILAIVLALLGTITSHSLYAFSFMKAMWRTVADLWQQFVLAMENGEWTNLVSHLFCYAALSYVFFLTGASFAKVAAGFAGIPIQLICQLSSAIANALPYGGFLDRYKTEAPTPLEFFEDPARFMAALHRLTQDGDHPDKEAIARLYAQYVNPRSEDEITEIIVEDDAKSPLLSRHRSTLYGATSQSTDVPDELSVEATPPNPREQRSQCFIQ